jgi:hypothetical protein
MGIASHRRGLRWLPLLLALLGAAPAHALRCGSELVGMGAYTYEVRQSCGEPQARNAWTAYRIVHVGPHNAPVREEVVIPISVEEWVYDFGPHRLVRVLRFEAGRLVDVSTLGYGR